MIQKLIELEIQVRNIPLVYADQILELMALGQDTTNHGRKRQRLEIIHLVKKHNLDFQMTVLVQVLITMGQPLFVALVHPTHLVAKRNDFPQGIVPDLVHMSHQVKEEIVTQLQSGLSEENIKIKWITALDLALMNLRLANP